MDIPLVIGPPHDLQEDNLLSLTADVVSAYVSNNALNSTDLPRLIGDTYRALKALSQGSMVEAPPELTPATTVRKSVTPDYIICLDDGKKFKSLKRHLGALGMTPDQYRAKWSLPFDYPMVAPNYAATRSALAKKIGLGRKPVHAKLKATGTKRKAKMNA